MHSGQKIATARRYHAPALTQHQLAELVGLDRSSLARYESRGNAGTAVIDRISEALGIQRSWFDEDSDTTPRYKENGNLRPTRKPEDLREDGSSLVRGDQVMLAVWRGVMASDGECEFWPNDSPEFRAIPSFLASSDPDSHVLCISSGLSMKPRLDHAERAVVRLDPDPPIGSLVVARRPDGANFVKVLRSGSKLELHSLNPDFEPILDLQDWSLKGYVVAILHTYVPGGANIEWDDGRPLRA